MIRANVHSDESRNLQARVLVRRRDGSVRVQHFDSDAAAYRYWLGLPRRVRACFRGAGDVSPVQSWDYVSRDG